MTALVITNARVDELTEARSAIDFTPEEVRALAIEVRNRRAEDRTIIERIPKVAEEGDLVEIEWEPGRTKLARYVRVTRTGTHVVKVERVDSKGRPTGQYGSDRTIAASAVVRVVAPVVTK